MRRRLADARDVSDLFQEVEPFLVGVWKFRERGKSPTWCATVLVQGEYFDIPPSETVLETLKKAIEEVAIAIENGP